MKSHTLPNTFYPYVTFIGVQIAYAETDLYNDVWHALTIYRTAEGFYIGHRSANTPDPQRLDLDFVEICKTPEEIMDFCERGYAYRYLASSLLDQAGISIADQNDSH